jgi:hypothetical protein
VSRETPCVVFWGVRDTEHFLARLWALEDELVAAGLRPINEWWRREIERFYRTGKRRWTVRKGRRVFASTCVAPRLAVAEALFGEHEHIPGSPPLEYAFVSVKKPEALKRLEGIRSVLQRLAVLYDERGETITLRQFPATFIVMAASFRTAVGGTCAFAWLDEVSRWNDDKNGKNPAEEVVASLAPALSTLPNAKMFLISSPLTDEDFHAKQFDLGETPAQHISFGETWVINPEFTEEQTHIEEPDPRIWAREYAAIPSPVVTLNWFGIALDASIARGFADEPILDWVKYTVAIDPAFTRDKFGWAVGSSRAIPGQKRVTRVHETGAWPINGRKPSEMVELLRSEVCIRYHVGDETSRVLTDQHEGSSFSELASQSAVRLEVINASGTGENSVLSNYSSVRIAMLEGTLLLPNDAGLHKEMKRVSSRFLPSGHEQIVLPRNAEAGHLDRVSAMVLLCAQMLKRSPQEEQAFPVRQLDEGATLRQQAIKAATERQKKQWERDPRVVMRAALGR